MHYRQKNEKRIQEQADVQKQWEEGKIAFMVVLFVVERSSAESEGQAGWADYETGDLRSTEKVRKRRCR